MLKGADVRPFTYTFKGRYLCFDPDLIDRGAGEYASFRDPAIFVGPKLLSRQTSDRLVACLDREEHVSDNTLHCIQLKPSAGISLEWLELLLNSKLATFLYRIQSGEQLRPLPQIKLKLLRRLPIREPRASAKAIRELAERVEREARQSGPSRKSIAQIDRLVFDAYDIEQTARRRIKALAG